MVPIVYKCDSYEGSILAFIMRKVSFVCLLNQWSSILLTPGSMEKLPSGREYFDTNSFCHGCFGEKWKLRELSKIASLFFMIMQRSKGGKFLPDKAQWNAIFDDVFFGQTSTFLPGIHRHHVNMEFGKLKKNQNKVTGFDGFDRKVGFKNETRG